MLHIERDMEIGAGVRLLRERLGLTGSAIAHNVFGPDADPLIVRNFVDRLSKLERGEAGHRNPTLERLEAIARGMQLTLSSFFARIEALQSPPTSADNSIPPEPSDKGVSDERPSPVRLPPDPDSMGAAMAVIRYLTSELIRTRADAEMRRSAPSHRPDAPDGPRGRVSRTPRDRGHAPRKKNRRKR
jgi:transcriptional regulator with XRE-family HTH domain